MQKRAKFKPRITKVRLNPEQAVLACQCYNQGFYFWMGTSRPFGSVCLGKSKITVPASAWDSCKSIYPGSPAS